jgi:Rho termination factor, N-terminal domain
MNRIKIIALAVGALFVGGLRDQFSTPNVKPDTDKTEDHPPDPNSEVGLLIKGAEVDYKDVLWRIRAGLTPKQAVDVAKQEKLEAAGVAPGKTAAAETPSGGKEKALDDMTVAELKDLAASKNITITSDMKKPDIIAAISAA